MSLKNSNRQISNNDRGASLVIVALSMLFLLGMLGLGIDLASLYVGRTQAQRSADAAALAAAQAFVDGGCTSGLNSDCTTMATNRATSVGTTNLVAGVVPNISVTFNTANTSNPQVTVVAARAAAYGNAMPTFFIRVFGISSADVSASATAETYNPSGQGVPVGVQCVKPWFYPNCDYSRSTVTTTPPGNPNCLAADGTMYQYLVNPSDGSIQYPGLAPAGLIGESIQVKPSDPSQSASPSKFYTVLLPSDGAMSCPLCANGGSGTGTNSGSNYQTNIECCNQANITCGTIQVTPVTGNKVGPTGSGVDCLINQKPGNGQDIIDVSTVPFTVTAGANNLLFPPGSQISLSDSPSTVSLPIFDGTPMCPGGSCPATVNIKILGFLQVFITGEQSGNVNAYITNVAGCGNGGGGNPINASGAAPLPVRLIYPSS